MLTRNGICYDLPNTPYRVKVDGVIYHFSSELYRVKFIEKRLEHRQQLNASLSSRFNMEIETGNFADIILYRKIEKRGFLIYDEVNERCQNNIRCGGVIVTYKS